MCGICGFTGYRQDQKTVIERMMKAIAHRGPDSKGSFCREKITLGFRRLSIIDLEDGQQPMESADGNLHIVFNGEIYDYKELREELEASGISFRTHSDTEVLVNTIQQYGEKALDKLRGMFGFAVWDEKEQTLMLARDFFGIKPVYYAEIDGHFVFASEIKSILAFPGYERKVNQKALEQYLSFQYSPLKETFFKGIYKLMPGHMLLYKNGNYEIKTYFKTKLTPGKWDRKTNMEQLRSQLAEILKDSVKRHMLSDVEVGAFLSGGVDSGYLASASGADQAFTVGFDEGDRAIADFVCSHCPLVASAEAKSPAQGCNHSNKYPSITFKVLSAPSRWLRSYPCDAYTPAPISPWRMSYPARRVASTSDP